MLLKDQEQLVRELSEVGFVVESVYDLVNNRPIAHLENKFIGSYAQAYPILVRHLDLPHHSRIREGIIRALTEKSARAIAKDKLLEHFYKEEDPSMKWVLANALRTVLSASDKKKHPEYKDVFQGHPGKSSA